MHPFIAASVLRCWEREAARPRPQRSWLAWLRLGR